MLDLQILLYKFVKCTIFSAFLTQNLDLIKVFPIAFRTLHTVFYHRHPQTFKMVKMPTFCLAIRPAIQAYKTTYFNFYLLFPLDNYAGRSRNIRNLFFPLSSPPHQFTLANLMG
jgi:hypothetical protein